MKLRLRLNANHVLKLYNGEKGDAKWMKWFFYLYLLCHRSCHENAENTILSFQIGVAESGFVKRFVKISKAGSDSFGG